MLADALDEPPDRIELLDVDADATEVFDELVLLVVWGLEFNGGVEANAVVAASGVGDEKVIESALKLAYALAESDA